MTGECSLRPMGAVKYISRMSFPAPSLWRLGSASSLRTPALRAVEAGRWYSCGVYYDLVFKVLKTGLTRPPTEISMCKVADRGLRFRFGTRSNSLGRAPGHAVRFEKMKGQRGQINRG